MSSTRRVTPSAVKLPPNGWVGVGIYVGRCQGHVHETPELAKLCAMHREQGAVGDPEVLLMPLPRRTAKAATGTGSNGRYRGARQPRR
jgi:hypothetical protein